MHLQPVFADAAMIGGPVSERLFAHGLCLPSGSAMTDADVDRVCDAILTMAGDADAPRTALAASAAARLPG